MGEQREAVGGDDLILAQVALGHDDARLAHLVALPGQQAEMRIGGICPCGDEFGCSLPGHGVDEKILYGGIEDLGALVGLVVVAAEGEEVAHFLVKALLGGPNISDALQHLVEVIRAAVGVLQPLVIHHETLDQVVLQDGGSPPTELHATGRAHPVAHGQNRIEVVEGDGTLHLATAFDLNCQGFLDSCRWDQLSFGKDVLQVQGDVLLGGIEEFRHFELGQPDGLLMCPQLDVALAVVAGV